MRTFTSADAKNNFGELIDMARAAPVAITKYERPVVVVLAVEEFERLAQKQTSKIKRTPIKAHGKRRSALAG
jgi:prevent-host-death family protein